MPLNGIVPSALTIENGLTYASVHIPLEKQGLVFVRGINYDTDQHRSNGSGKSSFADILEHVLFESTSRGLNKDDIIRAGSSQGYYAKLCLKKNSETYYIEQARNHSKYGTSLVVSQQFEHGIEPVSAPKNINKSKQYLNQLLGMTLQQFHGYVYLSQDAGSPLVTGSGAEVSKYLSSTFGHDVYDGMRLKIKEFIDQLQERAAKAETYVLALNEIDTKLSEFKDIPYIMDMEIALAEHIDFGQEQLSFLHDKRTQVARNKAVAERRDYLVQTAPQGVTVEDLQKVLTKRQKLLNAIANQLTELTSQLSLAESRKHSLDHLSNLQIEYAELLERKPDNIQGSNYAALVNALNNRLQKILSITSRGDQLLNREVAPPPGWDTDTVVAQHKEAITNYADQAEGLMAASSQYEKLKEALGSPICPTCGQDVPHTDSKEHLEHEIAKALQARKQYKALQAAKTEAATFLTSCEKYQTYRDSLQDVINDIQKLEGIVVTGDIVKAYREFKTENDTKSLRSDITYATQLRSLFDEMGLLEQSLSDTVSHDDTADAAVRLQELKEKSVTLTADINTISKNIDLLEELEKLPNVSLQDLESTDATLTSEILALKSALKETQIILSKFSNDSAIIKDLQQRKDKSLAYLDQFKEDLKQLEWLKTLYKGLAKLKARKLHAVVQSIRDTLPQYVDTMFDGEDISFDINDEDTESVLLWAVRKHPEKKKERVWIPVKGLSKGERAGLRVSLLWTLKDIMQPDKSVDLLILDEADDGLDEAGLAAFCALLGKIRSQYGTVIVISQRRELTGVRFDQIWTAVKRDGVTTLDMN